MIVIREARKSDLNQIKELNWKFFVEQLPQDEMFKVDKKGRTWGRRFVDKTFKNKKWKYIVGEDDGKIIGITNGKIEVYPPIFKKKKLGYLFIAYVLPQYRRKGIGKKLLNKILTWFKSKGISAVETDVYFKNPYASVWRKLGFKEIYKRMRLNL